MEEEKVQEIKKPGLRISPLNFLGSLSFVAAGYFMLISRGNIAERGFNGLYTALCILAVVVFFLSDIIFRSMFISTKKLWIVELSFIAFACIMTLILKIVIFN